jgi:hypothetical protein
MSKVSEALLQSILEELQAIRKCVVPPAPPSPDELERDLTVALGVGPDEVFNK